jgi:hypothetical protein
VRLAAALCAAVAFLLAAAAPPAAAQSDLKSPPSLDKPPPLRQLTGNQVLRIADAVEKVRDERAKHPGSTWAVFLKGGNLWQVSYYAKTPPKAPRKEIAQVIVGDRSGAVLEAWTGFYVPWTMARGYDGAFGRKVNAPYIWIPLAIAFVLPFFDPRRIRRLLHVDLLVLSGFSGALAFFNAGKVEVWVPIVAALLAYLLARMLWIGLRRRRDPPEPLHLLVPVEWLAIGIVFLLAFRIGLNVTDSNVIDVGFAGVVGADKLVDGSSLYDGSFPKQVQHGDTYGPINYLAYVPFELALPWSGTWDELPAAHAASIAFDLLTILAVWLLGRRVGGPRLGVALAYAWAACPFSLYAMNTGANDSLVTFLVVATLLAAGSPPARGALTALAGLTKFAPLALAPLMATHGLGGLPWRARLRRAAAFAAAFAVVAALALALTAGDLGAFWERTIAFQADRGAPFSIWGLYGLDTLQVVAQGAAVVFALAVAVVPRRDDLIGLAALAAAVLIALQLAANYWFFLYVVWFLPLVLLAVLTATGDGQVRWSPRVRLRSSAPARP